MFQSRMPFSTNQIVWAKSRTENWQPAFVIDVTNDIWSLWNGPIEEFRPGHRHVFIIGSKSIELVKEEDSIRDFCLGYVESYLSVSIGSDAMKALPLLVQMAAILSGEEVYPGQDWDWQSWAIDSIRNCEPIRVSKKFYEKFTKKSRRPIPPPMRNSCPTLENVAVASVSDDAVVIDELSPEPKHRFGSRKTPKSTEKTSPRKSTDADELSIFVPESCDSSETKNALRASQLVWAFRSGGLKERWWPAVVIETPASGSSTAVVAALNKTHDLFRTRIIQIEHFCTNFNLRVDRVAVSDPEERSNYMFAVRKAVEYVQDSIGGVNCEESQWLNWAQKNIATLDIGEGIGLSGPQWADILARTQNQLVQLKRREVFGSDQRTSSREPLSPEKTSSKANWSKSTSSPPLFKTKSEPKVSSSKLIDMDNSISDMDQIAEGLWVKESSSDRESRKKRKHQSDLNTNKSSPKAKKSLQSRYVEDVGEEAEKSLHTPGRGTREWAEENREREKFGGSRAKSPSTKKRAPRKSSTSTDVGLLMLPLDAGWLRQITVRRSTEKPIRDVYYYFPKGISFGRSAKCRSGKEIDTLLRENRSHPACRDFDARLHFSFNGTLTTGHVREVLHAAGDKTSVDLNNASLT